MLASSFILSVLFSNTPSLAEIRDRYREQVTALDTLTVEYTLTQLPPDTSKPPDPTIWSEEPGNAFARPCYWQQQGRKFYAEYLQTREGRDAVLLWASFDGVRGYSTGANNGFGGDYIAQVSIANSRPHLPEQSTVWRVLGIKVEGTALSLLELFAQPEAKVVGREEIVGAHCWKVDFGVAPKVVSDGKGLNRVTALFDPQALGMPRRITVRPERLVEAQAKGINPGHAWSAGEMLDDILVHEFRSVRDERLQVDRLLPARVSFLIAGEKHFRLQSASINSTKTLKVFVPEIPAATMVVDTTGRTVKRKVAGGQSGLATYQRRELESAKARQALLPPPAPPSRPTVARPPSVPIRLLGLSAAAVLFSVAAMMVFRNRTRE